MEAVFPVTSLALGSLPLLVMLRLVRPRLMFLGIGAALSVVTLVIQPLPAKLAVGALFPVSVVAASVVAGLIAGVVQEGLKALPLRGVGPSEGAWLGAGFGVAEAAFVALAQFISPSSPPAWVALVPGVERLLTTWFHIVTAGILGLGWASGRFLSYFALAVAAHTGVDAAAAYISLAGLDPLDSFVSIPLYSGMALLNIVLTFLLVRGWSERFVGGLRRGP